MPIPVISVSQMRAWEDATWSAGRTEADVISRVGHIVTVRASQMTRAGDLIVILAGKGHNGDDARSASQNLADREIYLINVGDPANGLAEFRSQLTLEPALIIDGLFGIGLNRPLSADWIELVDEINRSRIPVLSIDTPSGLNADTGEVEGAAVRATVTLTLGAPKQGLLAAAAWPYVGRLEVAPDIGLIPNPPHGRTYWTRGEDFACFPPGRSAAGHKGTFGHLAIFAGSCGYHGAAVLAGKGALRARPGLVTLFTLERVYLPVAAQLQAAMVHPWMPVPSLPPTCSAVLFGPGLAAPDLPADLRSALAQLWQDSPVPVIADATGLEWLPPGPVRAGELRIMTPHPGEAARLLQTSTSAVQQDRPKAVLELSRRFGDCWVVLKGHQTILGCTGSELFVNSSGNPGLAQGGSGDVLAGFLGGLIAQPQLQADPLTTLRYGVWQHGAAADTLEAKRRNWTIEDLLADLGNVGARD